MQTKLPLRIVSAVVVILLLTWLWPSGDDAGQLEGDAEDGSGRDQLVSSIQPIGSANAVASEQTDAGSLAPVVPSAEALRQFEQANAAIAKGDNANAVVELRAIIERNPQLIEPYINLASLQAAQGQLDAARKTLLDGVAANPNYATLFANLRKVHGALAASAYQQALAKSGATVTQLELDLIQSMDASPADQQAVQNAALELAELRAQLEQSSQSATQANIQLASANDRLTQLQRQLQQQSQIQESSLLARQQAEADTNETSVQLADLQNQLSAAKQQVVAQQEQLKTQQQQYAEQLLALREQLDTRVQAVAATPTAQPASPAVTAEVPATSKQDRDAQIIARVQSWAKAWSSQQVPAYVDHYIGDYKPVGSSLTHDAWLAQRQVRLTNKRFINVETSRYTVTAVGAVANGEVSVTFTQRYRANTMDDTIRKELKFRADQGDWSQAKIVSERVLR